MACCFGQRQVPSGVSLWSSCSKTPQSFLILLRDEMPEPLLPSLVLDLEWLQSGLLLFWRAVIMVSELLGRLDGWYR